MQARGEEKVTGKLNYLDQYFLGQYFLGLALTQHLIKNGALSSAPLIRR